MAERPRAHAARPGSGVGAGARVDQIAGIMQVARAASRGDERALGELYERRFGAVFVAAKRATGRDEQFCMDVVQEAFLRVLRGAGALRRMRDEEHLDRWLVCLANTAALDLLRAERRRRVREEKAARQSVEGAADDGGERIARLERQLTALPAEDRALLRLRWAGMTLGVVAEAVGATVGSVQGRLRRAAAALSSQMKEHGHE